MFYWFVLNKCDKLIKKHITALLHGLRYILHICTRNVTLVGKRFAFKDFFWELQLTQLLRPWRSQEVSKYLQAGTIPSMWAEGFLRAAPCWIQSHDGSHVAFDCVLYRAAAFGVTHWHRGGQALLYPSPGTSTGTHSHTHTHTSEPAACTEDYSNHIQQPLCENYICHYRPLSVYLPLKYSWVMHLLGDIDFGQARERDDIEGEAGVRKRERETPQCS